MTRRPFFAIFCQVGAVVGVAVSVRAQPAAPVALAQVEAAQLDAVAVTPFANVSQDAADAWMGYGIAESVAVDLAARGGFEVVSGDRVQDVLKAGYDGLVRDEFQALAIGRELDTQWVITGGYQRLGGQLRITARLLETRTGEAVRAVKIDGPFEEIFELQDRIARELVDAEKVPRPARAMRSHAGAWPPIPSGEGGFGSFERGGAGANGPDVETSPGTPVPPSRSAGGRSHEVTGSLVLPQMGANAAGAGIALPSGATPASPAAVVEATGLLPGRPNVSVVRTDQTPNIDGNLDDAVWQNAVRITEFVQQSPLDGAPATEETEVYLAYDDTHLYVGMYAHYADMSMMRASRVDRDRATFSDDYISVYFDTFLDQKRAYVFSLNGYGVQNDSLLEPRSGGGGSSRGRRGGFSGGGPSSFTGVRWGDQSWDALFESGGTVVEDGWTAEMAIPFKSLRYPSVGNRAHRWGFQIARRIRGKDEYDVWSPMSRDVSGLLRQMGVLDGLSRLSTSRNLEILPTVTAVQVGSLDRTSAGFPSEAQPEGGMNVKYGLTSNLTLDATFNPDFSQIESDRPQISVNQRFPLFFPELRPFFLEGQEIFNLPGPVNFVHTRTIVDPRYGGKVTGKIGNTTLGMLVANDEAPGNLDNSSDPAYGKSANVLIGRVRYDLYSESHIGAIVTDREFLDDYSRLAGVDGQFRLSDTTSMSFRAITTQNRDAERLEASDGVVQPSSNVVDTSGNMFDVGLSSQGRNLNYFVAGYTIAPEFDTAVGFVRRRNIRSITSNVGYRWWPEGWLINWGPTASYTRNWDFGDFLVDEMVQSGVNFTFAKNVRFSVGANQDMERFSGVDFHKRRYSTNLFINTLQQVSFGGYYGYGDEVNYGAAPFLGRGGSGGIFMTVRPFTRLQSRININTSNLIDPLDETEVFDVKILRALTTYQFTDRLLLRNILDYNTFRGTFGTNVLFTYRVNAGTVFFVGYDDRYQQGDLLLDSGGDPAYMRNSRFLTTDLLRTNRAFFTKISYLFRL
jgi:TolB-like protein